MTRKPIQGTTATLERLRRNGTLAALTRRSGTEAESGPRFLPIISIEPDPDQPRRHFDPDQLASLAESIREQGILQPITVQVPNAEGVYLIIMGERRYRAAKLAGLDSVPVIVREMTSALRMAQLTENVQRAELTTLEIGEAVAAMRATGQSRAEIGQALGWSEAAVSRFAAVPKMSEPLREAAGQGAPIRAVADLHALWKQDAAAVTAFLDETPAAEITQTTVDRLRMQLRKPDAEAVITPEVRPEQPPLQGTTSAAATPEQPLLPAVLPDLPATSDDEQHQLPFKQAQPEVTRKPEGAATMILRHGDRTGRAVLDQPMTDQATILVEFNTDQPPELLAVADLAIVSFGRS